MSTEFIGRHEKMARSLLIETLAGFWIDAYWNNEYEPLPVDSDGHTLYRFRRGNDEAITTFICGIEFDPSVISTQPASIVVSRRQLHETVFDSTDIFLRGDTIGLQRQGFGFSYDALDSEDNFNRIKNQQLSWKNVCGISMEHLSQELVETRPIPLPSRNPNL